MTGPYFNPHTGHYETEIPARSRKETGPKFCHWKADFDGNFDTDCGQCFSLTAGTIAENGMKFCCYCGKPLRVEMSDIGLGGACPVCRHLLIRIYEGKPDDPFPNPRLFRDRCFTCEPEEKVRP